MGIPTDLLPTELFLLCMFVDLEPAERIRAVVRFVVSFYEPGQ